jgi:hypothetical protein
MRARFRLVVSAFAILFLYGLAAAPAQVRETQAACSAGAISGMVSAPSSKTISNLPLELPQRTMLREEFERYNTAPESPSRRGTADCVQIIPTNQLSAAAVMSLNSDQRSPSRDDSLQLFAHRDDRANSDALIEFSPDYNTIYFPVLCGSFHDKSLAFDFDRILGRTFGDENVIPIFRGSKVGINKQNGGLLFSIKFPISD